MELFVVPPFTDFTTEVVPPDGAEVLDLNERLVRRLTDPARVRATCDGRVAAVLERAAYDDAHLRAMGVALRMAGDSAVRLTLDDLELAEGSTQSSRDVLGAADRCELFRPELDLAEEVAAGRRVHVLVDALRQLPAAFALVRALGAERVTLCGRLVDEQGAALRRVPALAGAGWRDFSPARVIRPPWYAERLRWVTRRPPPNGPWAGRLEAARAAALPGEALARCRGLTITMTRIDFLAAVTGLHGLTVNLRRLLAAVPPDTPVACELAVGAPGMDAGVVGESLELLADGPGGVRLAGLRPYRMGIRSVWAGQSVRFPPATGHDLARWIEFEAPETLRAYEVTNLIKLWRGRLPELPPGRLAACSVAGTAPPRSGACGPVRLARPHHRPALPTTRPASDGAFPAHAQPVHDGFPDGYEPTPVSFPAGDEPASSGRPARGEPMPGAFHAGNESSAPDAHDGPATDEPERLVVGAVRGSR